MFVVVVFGSGVSLINLVCNKCMYMMQTFLDGVKGILAPFLNANKFFCKTFVDDRKKS